MEIAKIGPDLRLGKERRPREVGYTSFSRSLSISQTGSKTIKENCYWTQGLWAWSQVRRREKSEGSSRNFILTQFMEFTNRFENKQKELSPRLLCGCKKTTSQPFCFRIFLIFFNGISYLTYLAGRVKFTQPFNLWFVLTSVWTTQQTCD